MICVSEFTFSTGLKSHSESLRLRNDSFFRIWSSTQLKKAVPNPCAFREDSFARSYSSTELKSRSESLRSAQRFVFRSYFEYTVEKLLQNEDEDASFFSHPFALNIEDIPSRFSPRCSDRM